MRAGGSLSDSHIFQTRKPLPCPPMWQSPQDIAFSLSSMKAPLPTLRTMSLVLSGADCRSLLAPKLSWGFFWRSWPRLTPPATTLPGPHLCTLLSGFILSHAPVPLKGLWWACGWASFFMEINPIVFSLIQSTENVLLYIQPLPSVDLSLCLTFLSSTPSPPMVPVGQACQKHLGGRPKYQNNGVVEGRLSLTYIHMLKRQPGHSDTPGWPPAWLLHQTVAFWSHSPLYSAWLLCWLLPLCLCAHSTLFYLWPTDLLSWMALLCCSLCSWLLKITAQCHQAELCGFRTSARC